MRHPRMIILLTVPIWNILVRDSGRDVEHDDAALPVDIVSISETTKLLLPRRIPHIELNLAVVLFFSSQPRSGLDERSCG